MERILRGIMRYRNTTREQMVKEFQKVRDNPEVSNTWVYRSRFRNRTISHLQKKNNLEHAFALWGTNCPCFISLSHFFDLSVANLALSPISLFISALFWVLFGKQTTKANRLTTKLFQFTPFCLLNIKLDFHILSWLLFGLLECRAPLLIINFI